jgi:hypothetical protein
VAVHAWRDKTTSPSTTHAACGTMQISAPNVAPACRGRLFRLAQLINFPRLEASTTEAQLDNIITPHPAVPITTSKLRHSSASTRPKSPYTPTHEGGRYATSGKRVCR